MFKKVEPGNPWIRNGLPMANRSAPWHPISTTVMNWMVPHRYDIEYQFNHYGYRGTWGHEQLNRAVWCLGDSQTLGLGVAEHETWPARLAHMIGQPTINMAVAGCSNDTMSRILLTAGQTHRPRAVMVLVSAPNRREMFAGQDVLTCFPKLMEHIPDTNRELFQSYVQSQTDSAGDLANRDRNLALMEAWCKSRGIAFCAVDFDRDVKDIVAQDPAADGMHIGPATHDALAQWFARQPATKTFQQSNVRDQWINQTNTCYRQGNLVYAVTLKCASTYFSSLLTNNGWRPDSVANINWDRDHVFSFIMDPWKRRAKGIAEDLLSKYSVEQYLLNNLGKQFWEDHLTFGMHSVPMTMAWPGYCDRIDWIPLDADVDATTLLNKLLAKYNQGLDNPRANPRHESEEYKQEVYERISKFVSAGSPTLQLMMAPDNELYQKVMTGINVQGETWDEISWLRISQ